MPLTQFQSDSYDFGTNVNVGITVNQGASAQPTPERKSESKMHELISKVTLNLIRSFSIEKQKYSEDLSKAFDEALKKTPDSLYFDLDFDYPGKIGGTVATIGYGNVLTGTFRIIKNGLIISLSADCVAEVEFGFIRSEQMSSFKNVLERKDMKIFLSGMGNNGSTRKNNWSCAIEPALDIAADEIKVSWD